MADILTKAKRSWVMSRIRGVDTTPERTVRSFLHRRGFRFRLHESALPGHPDIVLPKFRTVVFVHGCFWHNHNCRDGHTPRTNRGYWGPKLRRNKRRDAGNARLLRALGWRRIVVWECELNRDP